MTEQATLEAPPKADLVMVPIDAIEVGPNVRTEANEGMLLELQDSLKAIGLMEPVIVRKAGKKFLLIAGHRRLEAARRNGEDLIEAKVYAGLDDRQTARMQLTENLQREQLNHVDVALQFGRARDAGMAVADIARDVNLSETYVRKHLDLLRLCEPVRKLVADGRLPFMQAQLIARVGDPAKQIQLVEGATRLNWNAKKASWGARSFTCTKQDAADHVMTMSALRENVGHMMLGMAACGWPRDDEFAGCRPCVGCPDNTQTYADQPALFAGISPRGSDKKGHCTNEACYRTKQRAWEKIRAKRKAEKAKARKAKIAKALKAGLVICEECAKAEVDGEGKFAKVDGRTLCPKCAQKANKRQSSGGSCSVPKAKPFPNTPQEKYDLDLYKWGCRMLEAAVASLEAMDPASLPWPELVGMAFQSEEIMIESSLPWHKRQQGWIEVVAAAKEGNWAKATGKEAGHLLIDLCRLDPIDAPNACRRELDDFERANIDLVEAFAGLIGLALADKPIPPEAETTEKASELLTIIAKGKKAEALAALAECEDLAGLQAMEGLKGDWRRVGVAKRIKALQKGQQG